jgi:hypothetical protein
MRLSQWLNTRPDRLQPHSFLFLKELNAETPYLPGLIWMVPEEAQVQRRIKLQLLEQIQSAGVAPGVNRVDAGNLAEFVASF